MGNEYPTVRFVEHAGKWAWKLYDEHGSVVARSPLFDSEREAKEDYERSHMPNQKSEEESLSRDREKLMPNHPDEGPEDLNPSLGADQSAPQGQGDAQNVDIANPGGVPLM